VKKKVGLWIDRKKAVIFSLADEGAEIKRIPYELENNVRSSGDEQKESTEVQEDMHIAGQLDKYYDRVLSYICDAESILIFGPGGAKLELKERLENMELHGRIVGIETANTMTDNQIVAKVRQHFLH
jgi:hypothetical protein